jgi:hypothetical protein
MVRKSTSIARRRFAAAASPLCLLMTGCGGDGGQVAYMPPPPAAPTPTPTPSPTPSPTPTPTSIADAYPATRVGTYNLLGNTTSSGVTASDFQMTVSRPSGDGEFRYALTGPRGFLPGSGSSVSYGGDATWATSQDGLAGPSYARTLPFSADEQIATGLSMKLGYSYVSMGSWEWSLVHLDGGASGDGYGQLVFVAGDGTPQEGIPASGTATYDAHTNLGWVTGPFSLTADFAQRTVSTKIDQDYRHNPDGDILDYPLAAGIHVAGSAPFNNDGGFDIQLAGTLNYNAGYPSNPIEAPPTQSVTGQMNGAFFGPHAEQVGGTFSLRDLNSVQVLQDAFIGQQAQP